MIADQSYNILFGLSKCLSIIIMAHNMSAAPFIGTYNSNIACSPPRRASYEQKMEYTL